MLAVAGRPFDSQDHFFEFKWDGYRAAAMVENGRVRLMSRGGRDLADRYPGLAPLGRLPSGLALDGEIVAFRGGRPDFSLLQQHGPRSDPSTVRYVTFDLLYEGFESRMDLPFSRRRQLLEKIAEKARCPELVLSEGLSAEGRALYRQACEQGLEGVVGKRLSSPYAAGKRNGAWIKVKRRLALQAAIIGYIEKPGPARSPARTPARSPAGTPDFQSLLVAGVKPGTEAGSALPGEEPGPLRYLGKVGSGFDAALRARIMSLLQERPRRTPLVPCPEKARWVEPGLYCEVSFAELTSAGVLRAPVFERLIEE
jgi:bifunctional non-homologous end joining protein LigD